MGAGGTGPGRGDGLADRFERHVPLLEGRIRRIVPASLRRRVSVADVIQEARIVAHERGDGVELRSDAALRAWLLEVVERKAREAVRHHARTKKRAAGREVGAGARPSTREFPARTASPSQQAMAAETSNLVRAALSDLPDDYREVLRLSRLKGLTLAEVATRMGRSREAVKKLYGRAVQRFTQVLERRRTSTDA